MINENNEYSEDLFLADNNLKRFEKCMIEFENCGLRKNNQSGGSATNQQPLTNVLGCGLITCFSVNYNQHKNFYNFFEESIADDFIELVYVRFVPAAQVKIQGYAEIINQQQGEVITSENKRVWLANVYIGKHFNLYIRAALKSEFLKRLIHNGQTGSSWTFKRFERLQIITTSLESFKTLNSS